MEGIEIRTVASRRYLGVRRVVPQDQIGAACADILPRTAQWLAARGLAPDSPPITVYHAVNRERDEFDIQPGFFVAVAVIPDADFSIGQTDAGQVLTATHLGPYETLGDTWHALFACAAEHGHRVTRSSWEIYLDDPGEVAASSLRTQICVPIDATD